MQISIRPAIDTDLASIYHFISDLENDHFSITSFREYYLQNISNGNYIYLVAENTKNEVIGYISCHGQILLHHCGWVFEIQELYVKNEFRGTGVGKEMVTKLLSLIEMKDYKSFEVTANITRKGTHLFYLQCGFIETHKKFTFLSAKQENR